MTASSRLWPTDEDRKVKPEPIPWPKAREIQPSQATSAALEELGEISSLAEFTASKHSERRR